MSEQNTAEAAEAVLVFVRAEPVKPRDELTYDDAGVPGIYAVQLRPAPEPSLIASAALDGFHENVPVEVIDDFTYTVLDESGNTLDEHPDHESYSLSSLCVDVEFHDAIPVPSQ